MGFFRHGVVPPAQKHIVGIAQGRYFLAAIKGRTSGGNSQERKRGDLNAAAFLCRWYNAMPEKTHTLQLSYSRSHHRPNMSKVVTTEPNINTLLKLDILWSLPLFARFTVYTPN